MVYTITGMRNLAKEIFHEEYKISCAKQDIEALKAKVEELTKRILKLENPPKPLTKLEKAIKALEFKIELETTRCTYRRKNEVGGDILTESTALIEMKYELLQLRKKQQSGAKQRGVSQVRRGLGDAL